jgi:hypothetical protein
MKINTLKLLLLSIVLVVCFFGCNHKKQVKKSPSGEFYIVEGGEVLKTDSLGNKIFAESITDRIKPRTYEEIKADEERSKPVNGKWLYSDEIDKMTNKHTITASVKSNNTLNFDFPYSGGSESHLWVRRWKGDLDIFVTVRPSQIVFKYDTKYVNIKIDDLPSKRFSINEASDYSSDIFFISNASSFLKKLKDSKKVLIEVTFHEQGIHVLEFDTEKLKFD